MELILALSAVIVIITISSGAYLLKSNKTNSKTRLKKALTINLSAFVPAIAMALIVFMPKGVFAAETAEASVSGLKYIGAALSTGFATIGTGYAVGTVGSAALGAVSEDSSILGKTLIFVGLAEGIAIYGLIISIMILA